MNIFHTFNIEITHSLYKKSIKQHSKLIINFSKNKWTLIKLNPELISRKAATKKSPKDTNESLRAPKERPKATKKDKDPISKMTKNHTDNPMAVKLPKDLISKIKPARSSITNPLIVNPSKLKKYQKTLPLFKKAASNICPPFNKC